MLIIPANSLASGGFAVDNSCRFDGTSDYLNRTPSAGNRRTWTWSAWVKRSTLGGEQNLLAADNNNRICFETVDSADQFALTDTNTSTIDVVTNQVFRDVSAWYHLVVAFDSTQATASNRVKLYVNGTQVTSLARTTYPSLNAEFSINNNSAQYIGRNSGGSNYFNGYMAETVFIDGSALTPTSFGEFDADSGAWKAIDVSGLTFGTNGFYLDFEDSAALGDDVSGNSNDFTVNNLTAIDQTTDTPTNNFATWNRLIPPTFSNHNLIDGNLTVEGETSSQNTAFSTFAVSSGKWFCEMKLTVEGNATSTVPNFGIASTADFVHADSEAYFETSGTNIYAGAVNNAQINRNGSDSGTNLSDTPDVGDIMGLALDLDSGTNTLKFYLNGSLVGTVNINADEYCFITAVKEDDNKATVQGNFGGTNTYTVSSGNADGNGYGNFEYTVPSGFLSLCTANLSEVLS